MEEFKPDYFKSDFYRYDRRKDFYGLDAWENAKK